MALLYKSQYTHCCAHTHKFLSSTHLKQNTSFCIAFTVLHMKIQHFHEVMWNSRHQLQPIRWHDFHFPKRLTQLGKTVYPLLLFASFLSSSICYLLQEIQILLSRLCHMCKGKSRSWFPIYNSTFPVMLHSLNSFWLKERKLCSWLQPLASRYVRVKMFMDLLFCSGLHGPRVAHSLQQTVCINCIGTFCHLQNNWDGERVPQFNIHQPLDQVIHWSRSIVWWTGTQTNTIEQNHIIG